MKKSAHPKLTGKAPSLNLLQKVSKTTKEVTNECAIVLKSVGMVGHKGRTPLRTILRARECTDIRTQLAMVRDLRLVERGECLRPVCTPLRRCMSPIRILLLMLLHTVTLPCLRTIHAITYQKCMPV